jgi:hypothetical protein
MMPIGGIEAGTLSHYLGVSWAIAIGGLVCGVAAWVTWQVVRRHPVAPS